MKSSRFCELICCHSSAETISCWMIKWTLQLFSQLQLHQSDESVTHPVCWCVIFNKKQIVVAEQFNFLCVCVCNPLIIDVKAMIYKLNVEAFENANSSISSPSLIIKSILYVCLFDTYTYTHFLNRWTVNHQIKRGHLDSPKRDLFHKHRRLFFLSNCDSLVWRLLFHLHKCNNYFSNCFLITFTAAKLFFHIIFTIFSESNHIRLRPEEWKSDFLFPFAEWLAWQNHNVAINCIVRTWTHVNRF